MPRARNRKPSNPLSLATDAGLRRWRAEHARVAVAAYRDSGLTIREFSERHGFPRKRLERWSCKLRKLDAEVSMDTDPVSFLPVTVTNPTPVFSEGSSPSSTGPIELTLASGIRVHLRPNFDSDALRRLLEVVEC